MADILSIFDIGPITEKTELTKIDQHFLNYSYVCGYQPTIHDKDFLAKFTFIPSQKYVSLSRWYRHISSFSEHEQSHWSSLNKQTGVKRKQPGPLNEKAKAAHTETKHAAVKDTDDDDDFDPFADDDDDSKTAKPAKPAPVVTKKEEKKPKAKVIEKSQLILHVKPASIDVDLDKVEKMIRAIQIEGVTWSVASQKIAIAYGLMKLQIGCTIIDELVQTDDITSAIECLGLDEEQKAKRLAMYETGEEEDYDDEDQPGLVSSAEIVSFNKL